MNAARLAFAAFAESALVAFAESVSMNVFVARATSVRLAAVVAASEGSEAKAQRYAAGQVERLRPVSMY